MAVLQVIGQDTIVEHLDRPDELTWDERRLWFEEQDAAAAAAGAGRLSEQACALMLDLQAAYCAGAWTAVVILAAAIADAQAFHAGFPTDARRSDSAWLRALRNRLMHENPKEPAITVEDQWHKRREWERNAQRAVTTAFASLYGVPLEARRRSRR